MSRLEQVAEAEAERLAREIGRAREDVRVVLSPYRICPIGAHSDHQGGPVLGMAIDRGTVLAWAAEQGDACRIESANFEGAVHFDGARPDPAGCRDWSLYARAAVTLLQRRGGSGFGLRARLRGDLPGSGLSSSASVSLAYLEAFAGRAGVRLADADRVSLARSCENEFVGVACGILDPASIVGARRGQLLAIDTQRERWEPVALAPDAAPHRWLVAYTGMSRHLAGTGFNDRVAECGEAARTLSRAAGLPEADRLGALDDAVFEAHEGALEPPLARRARHFFGERARVLRGRACFAEGRLAEFGALMNDSCRSSIECYETGSPELIALQQIMGETPGVLGARFSGAGFGGCSIALVEAEAADDAAKRIEAAFTRAFRAREGKASVFSVESDEGLRQT